MKIKKGAIFLDRDGVINKPILKDKKPFAPIQFENFYFYKNVNNTLKLLKKSYYIFIVTNQPDLSTGKQTNKELKKIHNFIKKNYFIDEICVCHHTKYDFCKCRKPNNKFYTYLSKKYNFSKKKVFFIGDTKADYGFALKSKINFFLIKKNYNKTLQRKVLKSNKFHSTASALNTIFINSF